jgi:two-component system, chemotaxis family, response regulator Rcp1
MKLLFVEDDMGDIILVKEALEEIMPGAYQLMEASDGEKAIDLLERLCQAGGENLPEMVFLDLNIPRVSGTEVLRFIKNDARLCHLPVIVFSSSESENDISRSYLHGANCYVTKPIDYERFVEVIMHIIRYWRFVMKAPAKGV